MDMTESIAPRSDQMNAEDLLSGPRTFTITEVKQGPSNDQPVFVYVAEHPQPFKPSKTVRRLMVLAWGKDSTAYVGKRMTLYRDPDVKFGGQDVGGIRVSHMSGISRPLKVALTVTRGRRSEYVVEPLPDLGALVEAFNAAGITDKVARLEYVRRTIGRAVGGATELTADEVNVVLDQLDSEPQPNPVRTAPPGGDGLELSDAEQAEAYEREQEARQAGG